MTYTPITWVDEETDVTAAHMNHLEQGVADAHAELAWAPVLGTRSTNVNVAAAPGPSFALDGQTLDGTIGQGGRVLLLGQTDPSQNGIWEYAYSGFSGASSLTRADDNTLPAHFRQGREVYVLGGTYADQRFTYVGWNGAVPDADPIPFHAPAAAAGKAFAFLMA